MEKFVEVENWGFNQLIIFSIFTMLFTVFQGYGFLKQSQKIWKNKSAEALSAPMFFLFFFYFISFFIYGLGINSSAVVFNGLLFLPCIPLMWGILKYKKLNRTDKKSFFVSIMIVPIMIITKQRDLFLSILLIVSIGAILSQLAEMIKSRCQGSLEIKFIVVFFVTAIFWLIYSSIIINWPLLIFNAIAALVYLKMFLLYYKYK